MCSAQRSASDRAAAAAAVGELRTRVLGFVESQRLDAPGPGRYRYSASVRQPTLYSSSYAAMARDLLGDLAGLPSRDREAWVAYLASHQDEDGLYRDPVIHDQGWYHGDPLWCGRPHLSCHVLTALACLGATARREIGFLDPYRDLDRLRAWLESRDWGERVAWTGNEVMNIGTLLQYSRDFHADRRAGAAAELLLDWLSSHHLRPEAGVWGDVDLADPVWRSHAVQAAYHWWPLYLYDGRPVPFIERAVDTVLLTQNPAGGFGWGVHNRERPFDSSACEDIDSMHPLAAFCALTGHRRDEARAALGRAIPWVLANQTADGGFAFLRGRPFEYGHPELASPAGQGAMFPTWFRLLALACAAVALPGHALSRIPWKFVRCPGLQFPIRAGAEERT